MPVIEKYANMAYITVTESAANTLTFKKLETGIAPFEKRAFLISRLEYFPGVVSARFAADNDFVNFGLTTSDSISALDLGENAVLDFNQIKRVDLGTAATGILMEKPVAKDLSTLPGGGILVAPNPLYLGVKGDSLVSAITIEVRIYYVAVELKTDEFWELVEMRRMIGT